MVNPSEKRQELKEYSTRQLTTSGGNDETLTYTSSNRKIATVSDKGLITCGQIYTDPKGKNIDKTTITIIQKENDKMKGQKIYINIDLMSVDLRKDFDTLKTQFDALIAKQQNLIPEIDKILANITLIS